MSIKFSPQMRAVIDVCAAYIDYLDYGILRPGYYLKYGNLYGPKDNLIMARVV